MQFFLFDNPGSQLFNYLNTVAFTFLKVSTLIERTLVKVILCFYLIDDARSHRAILTESSSFISALRSFQFWELIEKNDETSNKKTKKKSFAVFKTKKLPKMWKKKLLFFVAKSLMWCIAWQFFSCLCSNSSISSSNNHFERLIFVHLKR